MHIDELLDKFKKLDLEAVSPNEKKVFRRIADLLVELHDKNLPHDKFTSIESNLEAYFSQTQTAQQAKNGFKMIRKALLRDLSFAPANYYTALGIGIGTGIGTALGISFGTPFGIPMGIVYGLIIGSGIGLIGGLLVGRYLDKKAEVENRVLTNL